MKDPFVSLQEALKPLFSLEVYRNEKYVFPAVHALYEAIEQFNPQKKKTFFNLLRALTEAQPYLVKWRIDLKEVIKCMDSLAYTQSLPTINWKIVFATYPYVHFFQFSVHHRPQAKDKLDLLSWLSKNIGKPYNELNHFAQAQVLLEHRSQPGFSSKLTAQLKKDPDFLFELILSSERNFMKIVDSRLCLYLTDEQIAKAIKKHAHKWINPHIGREAQIEQLTHKVNSVLSHGRSMNTLLRNAKAKVIIESSTVYQTEVTHNPRENK